MNLTFLGAAGTVTGSRFLLETQKSKLLIDCGLFQGTKKFRKKNWDTSLPDPQELDGIILTHAHLDHSGYIPRLFKQGYKGSIYCSEGTLSLCSILLPDSGYIQEEDAEYINRKGFSKHSPALPLYTQQEARACLNSFSAVQMKSPIKVGDIDITFQPMGHIMGASSVSAKSNGKEVLFSGDVGRSNDLLMFPPEPPSKPDYIIMESTYGGHLHPKLDPIEALGKVMSPVIENSGVVLIPSFAVGRAQTLMFAIHQLLEKKIIPSVPVYLNSPMAAQVSELFYLRAQDHKLTRERCEAIFSNIQFVHSVEKSKRLNKQKGPMIIISASGMLTGGRVLHHLKTFGGDENNLILLVGFQAPGTRGEKLLRGQKIIKIHGQHHRISAKISSLDVFSAHADHSELLNWISKAQKKPKKTFLVHGEDTASDALRLSIEEELNWDACVPHLFETVSLI